MHWDQQPVWIAPSVRSPAFRRPEPAKAGTPTMRFTGRERQHRARLRDDRRQPYGPMPGVLWESLNRRRLAIVRRQRATVHPFAGVLVLFVLVPGGSSLAQPASPNRLPPSGASEPATFNRDLAPIIFKNCSPCH